MVGNKHYTLQAVFSWHNYWLVKLGQLLILSSYHIQGVLKYACIRQRRAPFSMKTYVNYSDSILLYKHDAILTEAIGVIKQGMMCHISLCGVASR